MEAISQSFYPEKHFHVATIDDIFYSSTEGIESEKCDTAQELGKFQPRMMQHI